ncbi:MAG: hypothetical protein FWD53_11175, partial [Phycisphaerales bacterium]|nr:hypothetical protein [Phycisphaerales bacterium]
MTSVSFFLMFMMMLAGGPEGPQDMLDMVPTEVYWQSKGITPSIEQLEKDAGPVQGEGSKARRLMAIRTLGEVKVAAAVPTLKLLVEAKEPFVAEYAKRAIAQIEGKPVAVAAKKSIADDLALLPKDVGIVGQFRGMSGVTVALEQLVPVIRAQIEEHEYMRSMVGELPDDKKFTSLLTGKVVEWVETVGNVRVDGMTLAVAEDVGNQSGWAMMIFRGKGDRAAFVAALKKTGRVEDEKEEEQGEQNIRRYRPLMKATQDEGIDIIELGEH